MDVKKPHDTYARAPRWLRMGRAAAYLGISPGKFLGLVNERKLPRASLIGGIRIWDRVKLDATDWGGSVTLGKRRWTKSEVDLLRGATLMGVSPGTVQALSKQFGRSPSQVRSKIMELRLRGEIADTAPPTDKRSPGH